MRYQTANFSRALYVSLFIIAFVLGGNAQNQVDQTFSAVPSVAPMQTGYTIQPDGKIVIWGTALTVNGVAKDSVAKLNADGTPDPTFNVCVCTFPFITNILTQPDGKLLIVGSSQLAPKVIRLNADGSFDATYNTSIEPGLPIFGGAGGRGLAVQPDGKLLIETTYPMSGAPNRSVRRLNTDGSIDTSFTDIGVSGLFTTGSVDTIALLPDGKILLAVDSFGQQNLRASVTRYNANGTADATFPPPTFASPAIPTDVVIGGMDVQADGSIIVAGKFTTVNGVAKSNFVRLFAAGNVDTTFTSTVAGPGGDLRALPSGKVLVTVPSGNVHKIVRLDSNGTLDPTYQMAAAVSDVIDGWSIDPSGRVIIFSGGSFVRLNPDGDLDMTFNPNLGSFGSIQALTVEPDGHVLAAGLFTQMNGIARNSFVRLNTNGSLDPSFDAGGGFSAAPASLLRQPDGKYLAVGNFASYNGSIRNGLARVNSDGSLDNSFNPTFGTKPVAMALQPDGKIIAVGNFSLVNGIGRTGLARLNSDGSLDITFAPVVGSPNIGAVVVQGDGKIVISGTFSGVNGFGRTNLARLNADGSLDESYNPTSAPSAFRTALQSDGKLVLANTNGTLTRRNVDGTLDAGFSPPAFSATNSSDLRINQLLVQANGGVVVVGRFDFAGGVPSNNIARLSSFGALEGTFFPIGSNGEIRTVAASPGNKLILGGVFTRFQGSIRAGIVRIEAAPFHRPAPFDFDGDGRTEISVTRVGALYTWYQLRGATFTYTEVNFGQSGDVVTPADFDGDGKTDIAIFRPSNGQWWYISSIDGIQKASTFEAGDDIPLPADLNGDGKADFVKYRPSTGQWRYLLNGGSTPGSFFFGSPGDKPLIGDYDGDGKSDFGIFRPSTGTFWYAASSQGNAFRAFQWGSAGDIPAVGDYDGDGKTDFAIYRPSNGVWWIFNSSTGTTSNVTWGAAEDKPIPADYDGDGRADTAVFRPSNGTWYLLTSSSGFSGFQWGISTDVPSPGAFVPQ